ncbi:hypothetical protein M6B38_139430 [Iris pallida]|uniref:Uncharacterized protein n=1 Tax=Iris pallida TaxID=29817 RepID=A0AAX6FDU2_IRIPA|nr:hypothetical protein M6B38_139430 [Iris pallida]
MAGKGTSWRLDQILRRIPAWITVAMFQVRFLGSIYSLTICTYYWT